MKVRSYCLPVRKRGDVFVSALDAADTWEELPRFDVLEAYLRRHYTPGEAQVQLSGRLYDGASVYVPRDVSDLSYVVVDDDGVPAGIKASPERNQQRLAGYLEWMRGTICMSEAILPEQAAYLYSQFLLPRITAADEEKSKSPSDGWHSMANAARFVMLGEAGAGKTTCMRRFALELAEADQSDLLPVYVPMRHWTKDSDLLSMAYAPLAEHADAWTSHDMESACQAGQIVLLLDGLDEIPSSVRSSAVSAIMALSRRYKQLRVGIATRESSYAWEFAGFSHFRIEPLSDSQVRELSYRRLGIHGKWGRFIDGVMSQSDVLGLVRNPLALSYVAALYLKNWLLPTDTAQIASSCVRVFLSEWDAVRGIARSTDDWASPHHRVSVLSRLSYEMMLRGLDSFSTEQFCAWEAKRFKREHAIQILRTLVQDSDLVVARGPEQWTVRHPVVGSHLAARHLVHMVTDVRGLMDANLSRRPWLDASVHLVAMSEGGGVLLDLITASDVLNSSQKALLLCRVLCQSTNLDDDVLSRCASAVTKHLSELSEDVTVSDEASVGTGGGPEVKWRASLVGMGSAWRDAVQFTLPQLVGIVYSSRHERGGEVLLTELRHGAGALVSTVASMVSNDGRLECDAGARDGRAYLNLRVVDSDAHDLEAHVLDASR